MKPILLVRPRYLTRYERQFVERYFDVTDSRVLCRDRLVVGRYSILPFYDELEADLANLGSTLVNSGAMHRWIAEFSWYEQLKEHTPETWTEETFPQCRWPGPFVVRGRQNSKKWNWNTHMFALDKASAVNVAERLKEDSDIREQGVVFRRYVPLRTFEVLRNDLPVTNEWRFFYLGKQRLTYGYYWAVSDAANGTKIAPQALELADHLATLVAPHAMFYTLDLAETETGDWILVEINDGQSATPGDHDLDKLYGNLRAALTALHG